MTKKGNIWRKCTGVIKRMMIPLILILVFGMYGPVAEPSFSVETSTGLAAYLSVGTEFSSGLVFTDEPHPGFSLDEFVKQFGYPEIYRVKARFSREGIPMSRDDQVNNLKEGHYVLPLSDKGLTDIEGINRLMVEFNGQIRSISEFPDLHLFLNQNRIIKIPDELGDMHNIVYLYLKENRIHEVPAAIAGMAGIEGMYFTSNRITVIPQEIFGMTSQRLRKLEFTDNQIKVLPEDIGNLTELIHFRMDRNRLVSIPESIGKLTQLRVVNFADNDLQCIPESFGNVPVMYILNLSGNKNLKSLPSGFSQIPGAINIIGTGLNPDDLEPELRLRVERERPPGNQRLTLQSRHLLQAVDDGDYFDDEDAVRSLEEVQYLVSLARDQLRYRDKKLKLLELLPRLHHPGALNLSP
jgi:hypothetical protein